MGDGVDQILKEWNRERPGLDVASMAIIGRLTRVTLAVESRLARTFSEHGLDAASFDVLATLLRSGAPYELSPSALSHAAMVTSSAIAQRLNKLVERELVTRSKDGIDKRGTKVRLTPHGRELVEKALPDHLRTEGELLKGVSAAEQKLFIQLLRRIGDNAAANRDNGRAERQQR